MFHSVEDISAKIRSDKKSSIVRKRRNRIV